MAGVKLSGKPAPVSLRVVGDTPDRDGDRDSRRILLRGTVMRDHPSSAGCHGSGVGQAGVLGGWRVAVPRLAGMHGVIASP